MTDSTLTTSQRELLQRWFDGELDGDEAGRAEQLHASSPAARTYVIALEELRGAARAAFETAGDEVAGLDAAAVVEAARRAGPVTDEPLAELAPMLERYHDGEVTDAERAVVRRLRRRREDVADYLEGLEEIGGAVRAAEDHASRDVDFGGLWEGVAGQLEGEFASDGVPDYEPETHQEWLHRYVDGELAQRRVAIVEAWIEAGDDRVEATLASLHELNLAARTATDEAVGRADFGAMWEGLSEAIDAEEPGAGGQADPAEIVDFDAVRRSRRIDSTDSTDSTGSTGSTGSDEAATADATGERGDGWSAAADDNTDGESKGAPVHWLVDHQQSVLGAVAAAVLLVGFGAFFGNRLLQSGGPGQQSPVVIVDSVEYGSGSSVLVDGPRGDQADRPDRSAPADEPASKKDGEKTTVIWLLDSESERPSDSQTDSPEAAPADSPAAAPDAGDDDGGSSATGR